MTNSNSGDSKKAITSMMASRSFQVSGGFSAFLRSTFLAPGAGLVFWGE